jgi:RNA polymerase sigma factor (sigma-70 family)
MAVPTIENNQMIDHIRRILFAEREADLSDGELLERFISGHEEAAVAALVRRHGPMVWGVCRRVLGNDHDAEDAFQATFLVLLRKAGSIRPREMVGNWLYGVAHQTALKARATVAKRQSREKQMNELPEPQAVTKPDLWQDLHPVLDHELSRLPDKYRSVIVLCDLEGKQRKEAARQLRIAEGTLSSRLTTARRTLAKRLARRGVEVSGGVLATVLAERAATACVPPSVVLDTIQAVSLVAAGKAAGAVSINVVTLSEGVVKTMFVTKLKIALVAALAVSVSGLGLTVVSLRALASDQVTTANDVLTTSNRNGNDVKGIETSKAHAVAQSKAGSNAVARGQAADDRKNDPQGTRSGASGSNNAKLQALLTERLKALQQAADRVKQMHKANAISYQEVRQAELRVYKAKLDLCQTTKERVAILEKIAAVYGEMEQHVLQLQQSGQASAGTALEARISRLEAEIAVEREKAKPAESPR